MSGPGFAVGAISACPRAAPFAVPARPRGLPGLRGLAGRGCRGSGRRASRCFPPKALLPRPALRASGRAVCPPAPGRCMRAAAARPGPGSALRGRPSRLCRCPPRCGRSGPPASRRPPRLGVFAGPWALRLPALGVSRLRARFRAFPGGPSRPWGGPLPQGKGAYKKSGAIVPLRLPHLGALRSRAPLASPRRPA